MSVGDAPAEKAASRPASRPASAKPPSGSKPGSAGKPASASKSRPESAKPADAEAAPPTEGAPAEAAAAAAPEAAAEPAAPAEEELPELSVDENGELLPLPTPYTVTEDGKHVPLNGVESLFLTGTTVTMVGLEGATSPTGLLPIAKEVLVKDIQFRGAISDFYVIKQRVLDADYDPLLIKVNNDDVYGDGNNYELAVTKEAAGVWSFILEEAQRRVDHARIMLARKAAEKAKPRSQRVREIKPWPSAGSELEVEEAWVKPTRERLALVVQRKRRAFARPAAFSDKASGDGWTSAQNECRPFKDPNYDLRRSEMDAAVQAVPVVAQAGVQATMDHPKPGSTQYAPRVLGPDEAEATLSAPPFHRFLARACATMEASLVTNEVLDLFQDDFAALAEDDGAEGHRADMALSELSSFTDLVYSKNKIAVHMQWLPHQRGFFAVACIDASPYNERVTRMGRPQPAHVLVWNFRDPIHPEYVLQAPAEVATFQYNPANPDLVVGGCYNGQVVVWDMAGEHERVQRLRHAEKEGSDEATIPVVKHKLLTPIEFSHQRGVADVQWLPGLEVSTKGKLSADTESGPRACNFFATLAGDGKLCFWDARVERMGGKRKKKSGAAEDPPDAEWKAIHTVQLLSAAGLDLSCCRLCFNPSALLEGNVYVSSLDGELLYATVIKPDGEDNPDYTKRLLSPHCGPVQALQRSPFFNDLILTVGDWTFQVWREGAEQPLFVSPYAEAYYTTGRWSPTRPGVVFLGDEAGRVEVWDLLDSSHEAALRVPAAPASIVSMAFNAGQVGAHPLQHTMLAVGDAAGVLHVLEVPRNLRRPTHHEQQAVAGFFDRMQQRLEDVAGRSAIRADTLKAREEEARAVEDAASAAREAAAKAAQSNRNVEEEARVAAQKEYERVEYKLQVDMGLIVVDE